MTGSQISRSCEGAEKHEYDYMKFCGSRVCIHCGDHPGLERCYCGWSRTSPGRGRQELEEMGETIDPED